MEIVLPVFSYNFVFKYTCIVVCFFSTEKRKYYMSCIWEPWKSLITNFLSRSVLVKSVLRLNQNFICPPWIIIEPEKRRNFWSKLGWKGVWPLNGFCLQLKTKAVFLWGPLKNGMGAGGRGIHNFRICSFRYWGESQFRVDILPYKKKNCICGCPRLCQSFHASLYMSFVKV